MDGFVDDEELLEQRLVESLASVIITIEVGLATIAEERHGCVEVVFDRFELSLAGSDGGLGLSLLSPDSVLFFSEQVKRDGVVVVSLQELSAFGIESGEPLLLLGKLFVVESLRDLDVINDSVSDLLERVMIELNLAVPAFNRFFDNVHGNEPLLAVGAVLVATQAVEIRMDRAGVAA